jgi:hypothetical protein
MLRHWFLFGVCLSLKTKVPKITPNLAFPLTFSLAQPNCPSLCFFHGPSRKTGWPSASPAPTFVFRRSNFPCRPSSHLRLSLSGRRDPLSGSSPTSSRQPLARVLLASSVLPSPAPCSSPQPSVPSMLSGALALPSRLLPPVTASTEAPSSTTANVIPSPVPLPSSQYKRRAQASFSLSPRESY